MKIGQPLHPGRQLPEGVVVEGGAGWLVLASFAGPAPAEVRAFERDRVEVAVGVGGNGHVLLWCLNVPAVMSWSAAVWAPWERSAVERTYDGRQVVQVGLVDARTTKLRALRTLGLGDASAAKLRALEAACVAAGRDDKALEAERAWAATAPPQEVETVVSEAGVRTFVEARRA